MLKLLEEKKLLFQFGEKFKKKEFRLEQITDIIGFRIILKKLKIVIKLLGIFHKEWNCIPGKFKDYISSPKLINTNHSYSCIGPNRRPIEIQIRTCKCMSLLKEDSITLEI